MLFLFLNLASEPGCKTGPISIDKSNMLWRVAAVSYYIVVHYNLRSLTMLCICPVALSRENNKMADKLSNLAMDIDVALRWVGNMYKEMERLRRQQEELHALGLGPATADWDADDAEEEEQQQRFGSGVTSWGRYQTYKLGGGGVSSSSSRQALGQVNREVIVKELLKRTEADDGTVFIGLMQHPCLMKGAAELVAKLWDDMDVGLVEEYMGILGWKEEEPWAVGWEGAAGGGTAAEAEAGGLVARGGGSGAVKGTRGRNGAAADGAGAQATGVEGGSGGGGGGAGFGESGAARSMPQHRQRRQRDGMDTDESEQEGVKVRGGAAAGRKARRRDGTTGPRGTAGPEAPVTDAVAEGMECPRPAVALRHRLGPLQQWENCGMGAAVLKPGWPVAPAAPTGVASLSSGGSIHRLRLRCRLSTGGMGRQQQQQQVAALGRGCDPRRGGQVQAGGMGGSLRRMDRLRGAAGGRGTAGGRRGRLVGMGITAMAALGGYIC